MAARTETRVCEGNSATTLCSADAAQSDSTFWVQFPVSFYFAVSFLFHHFHSGFIACRLIRLHTQQFAVCRISEAWIWSVECYLIALWHSTGYSSNTSLRTSISPSVSTQGIFMHWAVALAHNGFLCATALDPDSASPLGRESSTEITGHLCFSESVCTSQQVFKGVLLHYRLISF